MKQLTHKLWAKATALILLLALAVAAYASGVGIVFLAAYDAYIDGGETMRKNINEDMVRSELDDVLSFYESAIREEENGSTAILSNFEERFSRENSNLVYTILTTDGTVLSTNDTGEAVKYSATTILPLAHFGDIVTETHSFAYYDLREQFIMEQAGNGNHLQDYRCYEEDDPDAPAGIRYMLEITMQDYTTEDVELTGAVAEDMTAVDQFRRVNYWLDLLISLRHALIILAAGSLILCFVLFVFLLCAAGHKEGEEGIHLNWISRIPFDLLAAALIGAGMFVVVITHDFSYHYGDIVILIALGIGGVLCLLLLMTLLLSFSARVKAGRWWRNTVCWHLISSVWRICRWTVRAVTYPLRNLSGCWKALVITSLIMFGEFMLALMWGLGETLPIFWLLERVILLFLLVVFLLSFRRIEEGGRALASGNLGYQLSTEFLQPPFLQHARHLNEIGTGMQKAVEQQMKSERMKTELITNVSHDIKTPLTSIVNYVGLMKTLDLQDETAKEYLEVLDRQSARLRKLTEDLVEASKASTGNLAINRERTDINLLLMQAAGEYEDRLRELQLEPVTRLASDEAIILADGKLLWRIFDNLMSNICKYSLPGTRVYLSTEIRDGRVTASFKNISRYALDISSDELMERFVRGDSSRSTEGSGLGLSIARSLATLQGGSFNVSIDGDLFRADVSFSLVE